MMIRVTFIDGDVQNYESEHQYHFNKTMITKIEKQVKDLTLDEVSKLGLEEQPFSLSDIIMEIYECMSIDERSMNDYIDITSLVKGQYE